MSSCTKMPQIRKLYERFNVGAMMKARRQAKEEAAIGHKSVQQLRKRVDAVAAKKRRRLQGKLFCILPFQTMRKFKYFLANLT